MVVAGTMAGEAMADLFRSLWKSSRRSVVSRRTVPERRVIGVLSFEVASLMSKLVNLWYCLEDREILRLKAECANTLGIKMFVSEDVDHLMDLALMEVMENLGCTARATDILGKRCIDPIYHHLKRVFDDPVEIGLNWCGWEYRLKKMDRKVKKMERFVAATSQLYQELEVLAELEQTLRRMRANPGSNQVKLVEFQQKVMWQRQEVKNFREMSPWVRTYDYTVRLLLRSILTIFARIKFVYVRDLGGNLDSENCLVQSNSFSVSPQKNSTRLHSSNHLDRSSSTLGLVGGEKNRPNNRKSHVRHNSFICGGNANQQQVKANGFAHVGHFKGCMKGNDSPVLPSFLPSIGDVMRSNDSSNEHMNVKKSRRKTIQPAARAFLPKFSYKMIKPPPSTLGHAALSLRCANIIILIDRLIAAPHLISMDARDDLYSMLPASIKASLRTKLKVFAKKLTSSGYDAGLAAEWRLISSRILDWLLPLAQSTVRWYSERNFERQHMNLGTNVLLVQTLFFADQVKTEATVTELLLGLNYLSRYSQEHEDSEKPFLDASCKNVYLFHNRSISESAMNYK